MRSDMNEVITERCRFNKIDNKLEKKPLIKDDAENLPKFESFSKFKERRLDIHIKPLERYLQSKIGQPWNLIWSDICKTLKPNLRIYIKSYVEFNIIMIGGIPYYHSFYLQKNKKNSWIPLVNRNTHLVLFVNPDTGLLEEAPKAKTYKQRKKEEKLKNRTYEVEGYELHKINNIWFFVKEKKREFFPYDYYLEKIQINKKYLKLFNKWLLTGNWGNKRKQKNKFFKKIHNS